MKQTDLYSFSYKKGTLVPWCKSCGESNFWRNGKNLKGKQVYKCKSCSFKFVWCSDLPNKRYFSNVIDFAVEIYTSLIGISLRSMSYVMSLLGVQVSHEAIRQWVLQDKRKHFIDDKVDNAQTWNVDETYIKIKGKGHWLWIVYCKETRQVLSWYISKTRQIQHARAVLRKARQRVNKSPQQIITDGLWQYPAAVKKEMKWHWREALKRHTIHSGIGKNAFVERVNKEVKRRVKWFSTFQSREGAEAFFKLFFYNFNKRTSRVYNPG